MDAKKEWERADLQGEVDKAVDSLRLAINIETLGPPDSLAFQHGRRLARCLIRNGVRMMLKLGAPVEVMLPVLMECAGKEAEAFVTVDKFANGAAGQKEVAKA